MSRRGALVCPELDELAKVLPERDPDGRFFWQDYVNRITDRFDGLPAPDGGESFVRGCLAAGCRAVPVIRRNTLWENRAPPLSDRRARGVFELRIRLGLFFAASLRYLVHGACRLRAKVGDAEWHAVTEQEVSFPGIRGGARRRARRRLVESLARFRRGLPAGAVLLHVAGGAAVDACSDARGVQSRASGRSGGSVRQDAVG